MNAETISEPAAQYDSADKSGGFHVQTGRPDFQILEIGGARDFSFDAQWRFGLGDFEGAEHPGFDDSGWRELDLPHDWSIEDRHPSTVEDAEATTSPVLWDEVGDIPARIGPFDRDTSGGGRNTGYVIGGVGWYRKHFMMPTLGSRHAEVRFDGIYENADVWLNGIHLGFVRYGYTSFSLDLTQYLNDGSPNVLAVRVKNLGSNSRWYTGSGIYRHSWMTVTDPLRIAPDGVHVTTPEVSAEKARIEVVVDAINGRDNDVPAMVQTILVAPSGEETLKASEPSQLLKGRSSGTFSLTFSIDEPHLWSLQDPAIYSVVTNILVEDHVVDTVTTQFGVRSLAMTGIGFLLNGNPIKMRGANIHHDHGPLGAVALGRSEARRVALLKKAGFNAIRTAHNPFDPAFYEACDRLGMLVINEYVDTWDKSKTPEDTSTNFERWWAHDLERLLKRDRNHPSIVMWSIGNEIADENPTTRQQELATQIRAFDATRPITQGGASGYGFGVGFTGPKDPHWRVLDVGDTHYAHDLGNLQQEHPDKAFIASESFAASIYEDWQLVLDTPAMIGDFAWTAWDHIGEAGVGRPWVQAKGQAAPEENLANITKQAVEGGPYPWYLSWCSDFDILGHRRPQSYYRSVIWGDSPLEIAVERPAPDGQEQCAFSWAWFDELRSWTWDVPEGRELTVRVYTTGNRVELTLNGAVIGSQELAAGHKRIATFTVPYSPGQLTATAFLGETVVGHQSLQTAGRPAKLRVRAESEPLTTSRDDAAYVTVEVVDDTGRLVPDAVVPLSFQVQGAGSLAAVANANPRNLDSFKGPRRWTYLGVAQAIVRPSKDPGLIRLHVSSPGLEADVLMLQVISESTLGRIPQEARSRGSRPVI